MKRWIVILALAAAFSGLAFASAQADAWPESQHPYAHNSDLTWSYTHPTQADYLLLTFSKDSEMEQNFDYLYLTDSAGNTSRVSGNLGGKTAVVAGNSFTIRLTSDAEGASYYGFGFSEIRAMSEAEYSQPHYTAENGVIKSYYGKAKTLDIPSQIDGQTITAIGGSVFTGHEEIERVTLPDGLTRIGACAFDGCTGLKSIRIPLTVERIEAYTFRNCSSLEGMLEISPASIGLQAFSGCSSLQGIRVPDKQVIIYEMAFQNCTSLTTMDIPLGVKTLSISAFRGCKSLLEAPVMADSLTSIGGNCFAGCVSLRTVTLPDGLKNLGIAAFANCESLQSVTLPPNVTEIKEQTFKNCSSLTRVDFPGGLTKIGSQAFESCLSLRSAQLPDGVTSIGDRAFTWCESLTSVKLPGNLKTLGEYIFMGDDQLKTLDIPDSVEESGSFLVHGMCLITVSRNSPLLDMLEEDGYYYKIRETEEIHESIGVRFHNRAEEIVAEVTDPSMSEYEKALALHDWVINHVKYSDTGSGVDYDPANALFNGWGVCTAYATLYRTLLDHAGIESRPVHSDDHIWNLVKMAGEWYHVDATWDDDDGDSIQSGGMYFGLMDSAILKEGDHHDFRGQKYLGDVGDPAPATSYQCYYYYASGKMNEFLAEGERLIQNNLDQKVYDFTIGIRKPVGPRNVHSEDAEMGAVILRDRVFTAQGVRVDLEITFESIWSMTAYYHVSVRHDEMYDLVLPEGLQVIEAEAFRGAGMETVWIPSSVTRIESGAFADCARLRQVTIPASVTSIADDAFSAEGNFILFSPPGGEAERIAQLIGAALIPYDDAQ